MHYIHYYVLTFYTTDLFKQPNCRHCLSTLCFHVLSRPSSAEFRQKFHQVGNI